MGEKLIPAINIGPGDILKDEMAEYNWSQEDLAEIMGMSVKSINHIINHKQSITVETAMLLGKAFQVSAEFWLNLEQNYRLRLKEEGKKEKETELKANIYRYMPLSEMKKKGWVVHDRSIDSKVNAYLNFWDQNELDFSHYDDDQLQYCGRQAKVEEAYTGYYTHTWLHKAKNETSKIKIDSYEKDRLKQLMDNLTTWTQNDKKIDLFLTELQQCGVKFIVLSHLQKTYLDGACFYDQDNPVIVYTGRYDRIDHFWWTIAHELAHVYLHLSNGQDYFVDNTTEPVKLEIEADQLASKSLKADSIIKEAQPNAKYFSEERLLAISKNIGVHPAVILGILQHHDKVSYRSKLNHYKVPVLELISDKWIKG